MQNEFHVELSPRHRCSLPPLSHYTIGPLLLLYRLKSGLEESEAEILGKSRKWRGSSL